MSCALHLAATTLAAVRPAARPLGRRFLTPGYGVPNKIAATRATVEPAGRGHLHGADNPTYLKKDGDKAFFAIGIVLTTRA